MLGADPRASSIFAMHRCPRCESEETRRSARRGIERVLSWVGLWPFRCERCDARFLRVALGGRAHGRSG
jgi:hypothetical protein